MARRRPSVRVVRRDGTALVTDTLIARAESRSMHSDTDLSFPFHYLSHAELLCFPLAQRGALPVATDSTVDAIIVPTIREADQLRPAADLAEQLRCPLIAIYSHRSADELSSIRREFEQPDITVVGLPAHLPQNLLDLLAFETNSHPAAVSYCALDISRKRNLGLALAQMCGWTRILFLDDDIGHLSSEKVTNAASLLRKYPVVGFQVRNYPDNSVIGHAKRLAGWEQDVFISGGSLLVDPQRLNGFFPPIYHEDWFCVLNHLCAGSAAVGGEVEQLAYSPFASRVRALLEEFGDILGEGLLWLIHHKRDLSFPEASFWAEAIDSSFWHSVLQRRERLLTEITRRLLERPPDSCIADALLSVTEARARRYNLAAEDFVSFVHQWLRDLAQWRDRLAGLPQVDSVAKALAELGLSHVAVPGDEEPQDCPIVFTDDAEPPEPSTASFHQTRHRAAYVRAAGAALIGGRIRESRDGVLYGVLSGLSRKLLRSFDQPRLLTSHDLCSRLGALERGGGAGGGV